MITLEEYKLLNARAKRRVNDQRVSMGLKPYNALKGQPSPFKGKSSPLKGIKRGPNGTKGMRKPWLEGEKPNRWKTGPNPELHRMYSPWLKSKAQAQFRAEDWLLTFDDFAELWGDKWDLRGRDGEDLCMTRTDPEKPWQHNNCEIVTRQEANRRSGIRKRLRKLG